MKVLNRLWANRQGIALVTFFTVLMIGMMYVLEGNQERKDRARLAAYEQCASREDCLMTADDFYRYQRLVRQYYK